MKKLNILEMEVSKGGRLTQGEIDIFIGVGGCTSTFFFPNVFSVLACARFITQIF
ncbi:hypothetical protein KUV50_06580 [Membranicola marinus]|uniref:Uncharacterized protein n=1 Tax=Membranihabitans marinus TaxID=1227546 RepID=A0A953HLC8_9BACT|nr:hypothetical protein [Membranihabitans marinus]MBY5957787.1 hypothetical protein [Membranihabitans marinus]